MSIVIKIDSVDRSSIVTMSSVIKRDAVNQQTDTLEFEIVTKPGQSFTPTTNSDVLMTDDQIGSTTTVFGGKIYAVESNYISPGLISHSVKCKDYSYDLGRQLVNETYTNMTVNAIIADILTNYTDGTFTDVNVDCTLTIVKYSFQRVSVIDAIQRLADVTGYSWYVDDTKDVHFFAVNSEPAPFNLTDLDGNYIPDSLSISDDFSQIRNRVFVQGGEIEGSDRTETFNGDGTKLHFKLSNKFAHLPTVTVSSVSKTVGVDYLDNEADYDCFWDYNQQYIRFKTGTVPGSGTNNISVTGTPLYTLVVQVEDPVSISQYGVFEFAKTDVNLKSREEAVGVAKTEIKAYKDGVTEGSFNTYIPGLRSGQVINLSISEMGISEDFVIQSTSFSVINNSRGFWSVKLATLRTVDLINFLISLLRIPGNLIDQTGDVVLEKTVFPQETVNAADVAGVNTNDYPEPETIQADDNEYVQTLDFATEFVAGPYTPDPAGGTDTKRVFILGGSILG